MKKLTSVLLVLIMVLAMGVSAFAGTIGNSALIGGSADVTGDVTVQINDNKTTTVYYVDVTWGTLAFTYNKNDNSGAWDPQTHTYGSGSSAAGWVENPNATVTINNHSNADIGVNVKFDGSGTATSKTVDGVYAVLNESHAISGKLLNAATQAYGEAKKEGVDGVTKVIYTVTPGGAPTAETTKWSATPETLDKIVVTISKVV